MKNRHAQISMEFTLLMTFMLFFFIFFFGVVQYRMAEMANEKELEMLVSVGDFVRNEINLAHVVEDGYERKFEIPATVAGKNYTFEFVRDFDLSSSRTDVYAGFELKFETLDRTMFIQFQPINVTKGNTVEVYPGKNTIEKKNGMIAIN